MNKNNQNIAFCGLDCESCEAYLATINNDDELREKVALRWSELNGVEIKKEDINCLGCRNKGIKTPFCDALCPIRQCAKNKVSSTCGGCPKLVSCEKIKMIISNNKKALDNLKKIK